MRVDAEVVQPFLRYCRDSPHSSAVIDADGTQCSYSDLLFRADSLAAQLPIEHGEMVGLSLPRGVELIAAMIGIVLAGGVYVPFAENDPPERLTSLRAQLGLRYWVGSHVEKVGDGPAPLVPAVSPTGDQPLYVMWTSGSTGVPKAVVVGGRGVLRLAEDRTLTDFRQGDRMCFASNPAFDAATWEIWAALSNGIPIVVIPHDDLVDARRLRTRFESQRVTLAFLTTALFDHLARTDPTMFGGLRTLAVGGEQMRPATVRAVLASPSPPARLVNAYGPTEATTFSASHHVVGVDPNAVRVPIGSPLLDTELVVVDDAGSPAAAGETGELWIAGSGVAWGYLGDPAATGAAFVERRFPSRLHTRWYRTGDLAVVDEAGHVECLGRIDRQLKINGHRIEPAEIEQTMLRLAGVRAAAALPRRRATTVQMVAFAVTDGSVDAAALTHHLRTHLPTFLVPAQVMTIDRFPVTSNGKLDEDALLQYAATHDAAPMAISDPLVDFITAQARRVLGDVAVHADDDLLRIGVDSLAAVELTQRIGAAGLPTPPPTLLLQQRTPIAVAEWVRGGWSQRNSTVVRIGQPDLPPVFFVPGGGSTALFISEFAVALHGRLRVVAIEARGMHTPDRPDRLIHQMATRVAEAVVAESPGRCVALCGHSSGGMVAYEAARQLRKLGYEVRLLLLDSRFFGNEGPAGVRWMRLLGGTAFRRLRRVLLQRAPASSRDRPAPAGTLRLTPHYERFLNIAGRASRIHRASALDAELRCLHVATFSGKCAMNIAGNRGQCIHIAGEHTNLARPPHLESWAEPCATWLLS